MVTEELLADLAKTLKQHSLPDWAFESREILKEVMGGCFPGNEITEGEKALAYSFLQRRIKGEPLQYIFGNWDFYGYKFKVGAGVLIPRPETEFLVELGIKHLEKYKSAVGVDLCAGSGCIGISLVKETNCKCCCIELSEDAFPYLCDNIKLNNCAKNITAINGDIFDENIKKQIPKVDFILSNPPYLTNQDMNELQTEVRQEPEMALSGGNDGLDFYRRIFSFWSEKLKDKGLFAVEIGMGQELSVAELLKAQGISPSFIKDYNGIIRIVYGFKGK